MYRDDRRWDGIELDDDPPMPVATSRRRVDATSSWRQFNAMQEEWDQAPLPVPRRSPSSTRSAAASVAEARRATRGGSRRSDPVLDGGDIGGDAMDVEYGYVDVSPKRLSSRAPPQFDTLTELRRRVPFLSSDFYCSDADALHLLGMMRSGGGPSSSVDDKVAALEVDRKTAEAALERRTDECERLRSELADARQKLRAVQQQATQSAALLSQKREEIRKQLLLEEGRTQKLQQQNKVLTQELDKLRSRVHHLLK